MLLHTSRIDYLISMFEIKSEGGFYTGRLRNFIFCEIDIVCKIDSNPLNDQELVYPAKLISLDSFC